MPRRLAGRHMPLLAKYIITYMLIFLCFLALMMPLRGETYDIIRQMVLKQRQAQLEEGLAYMATYVSQIENTARVVSDDGDFGRLALARDSLRSADLISMIKLQKMLASLHVVRDELTEGSYVLFKRNQLMISNMARIESIPSYYGLLFAHPGLDAQGWHASHFVSGSASFLPAACITNEYFGTQRQKNILTCVVGLRQSSAIQRLGALAFMLNADTLRSRIAPDETLEHGSFTLYGATGEKLLSGGRELPLPRDGSASFAWDGATYEVLQAMERTYGLTAYAALSEDVVATRVADFTKWIRAYIIAGLALALLLVAVYTLRQYAPMKRLLEKSGIEGENPPLVNARSNEYERIAGALDTITASRDAVRRRLDWLQGTHRMQLLENACIRGLYTQREEEELTALLGGEATRYCLAVLRLHQDAEGAAAEADEYLRGLYTGGLLLARSTEREAVLLFMDAEARYNEVRGCVERAVAMLLTLGYSPRASVSAPGGGRNGAYMLYRQAIDALGEASDGETVLASERAGIRQTPRNEGLPRLLATLYELVCDGNGSAVERFFLENLMAAGADGEREMDIDAQTAVRLTIKTAARDALAPDLAPAPPASAFDPQRACEPIKQYALDICEAVTRRKQDELARRRGRVASYIEAHYMDSQLCAASIADAFQLSEKYIYQLARENTGMTLGEWIEDARMRAATAHLRQTDWSVERVANMVGYQAVSTFYRAFKKRYGVSPNTWRETHRNT